MIWKKCELLIVYLGITSLQWVNTASITTKELSYLDNLIVGEIMENAIFFYLS